MKFWRWLFRGHGDRPGYKRFLDRWLWAHLAVGIVFGLTESIRLDGAANAVLLPLAGVFVGLCFAWGGNAHALLQSEDLEDFTEEHPGGFGEFVYVFQAAILVVLCTLILWGLAGLGIFDDNWPASQHSLPYRFVRGVLFFCASLTVRECWHVVLGVQNLLMIDAEVRRAKRGRR